VVCESCGSENASGLQFCTACNAFLWHAAATPVPTSQEVVAPLPTPPVTDTDAPATPSWFRRRDAGRSRSGELPSIELPPLARTDDEPALTARPPERAAATSAPPPSDSRPHQALAVKIDQSQIDVPPGTTASFRVTVRNTGALVEGCSVSVRGIPNAWQRMEPERFNLDVDGQCDVLVHITPPKSPKTGEGRTALAIVVRSEVNGEIEQRCDATLVVAPYYELTTGLEPAEIEGKRSGRTYVNIENLGNKTERLGFSGAEPGKRLRVTFRPSQLEVRPGQRASVAVDARARRRVWSGIEKLRQFSVQIERRDDGPPVAPLTGRFTHLASWPKWVLPVVFAVLAVAIPTTLLLLNRSLDTKAANARVSVPNVTDLTEDAAKQSLQGKQLVADVADVYRDGAPGRVVAQVPSPGEKVDKGTSVKLSVSTDRTVPNVLNKPWQVAKKEIEDAHLTMVFGGWQPSSDDAQNEVAWQSPDAGTPSPDGQVTVGVNAGRQQLKMIEVRGLDQVSTQTNLQNSGVQVTIQQEDSDKPRGTIIDQFPAVDTVIKKGDHVTLIVSSGHPPVATTSAPPPLPPPPSG
jgi:hypothetical protein